MRGILTLLCAILLFAGQTKAQDSLNLSAIGKFADYFGRVESVVKDANDVAYVSTSGVGIIGYSLEYLPFVEELWRFQPPFYAYDLAVSGNYLFGAATISSFWDDSGGVWIAELHEYGVPPTLITSFEIFGSPTEIAIEGNYAYIAADEAGLKIYDITNIANPTEVGTYPGLIQQVDVEGNYAYAVDSDSGIYVLDVTNPASPVRDALIAAVDWDSWELYLPRDVQVVGTMAYVADDSTGLRMVDVTNPSIPVSLGSIQSPGMGARVEVIGNQAFLFHAGTETRIVDVTNPLAPVVQSTFNKIGPAWNLIKHGDFVVVPNYYGFEIDNIVNPQSPVEELDVQTGFAQAATMAGNIMYIASHRAGLRIINFSNPANPFEISRVATPSLASDVRVVGNYAYVADNTGGLRVINVSNLNAPVEASYFDTPGTAYGINIVGNHAYIADGMQGVRIVNIANPLAPTLVGSYNTNGTSYMSVVGGNYCYVADEYNRGLKILNVSNPAAPTQVGLFPTGSLCHGVAVQGNYAFAASGLSGLWILDVTDPALPVSLGSFRIVGEEAEYVVVDGNYAYVAYGPLGVRILNISDPYNPFEVAYYDETGWARHLVLNGDELIVSDLERVTRFDISPFTNATNIQPRAPEELTIHQIENTTLMQLDWLPVTENENGDPIEVHHYSVYRSASLDATTLTYLGTPAPGNSTTFVDTTGTTAQYIVRATAW